MSADRKSQIANRKWDEPAAVAVFGIPFHDTTLEETLDEIDRIVATKRPAYIVTPNLDFAAQAAQDPELHRIILAADRILCDGMPLVWSSRILGAPLSRRVAGSDLVPLLAERAAKKGHRLYFLGSTRDALEKAKDVLTRRFPGLQICGIDSPPHTPLDKMNNAEIAQKIRAARPDILLVAFGCPKQEKWIAMNYRDLDVPCSIGIGASLDFIAEKTLRAPHWMQKTGTEWIFRLFQEPARLLRRYSWDFCFLISALVRHLMADSGPGCPAGTLAAKTSWPLIESDRALIADLSGIPSMDPREFGRLLRLYYVAQSNERQFMLMKPGKTVRRLLEISGVERIIPIVDGEPG